MKRTLVSGLAGAILALTLLWYQPVSVSAAQVVEANTTTIELGYGRGGGWRGWGTVNVNILIRTLSNLTGLDTATICTELQNGRSLADIAAAHGSSGDALVQAVVDAAKTRLDQAVANGRLTQAEADQLLTSIRDRATTLVNDTTLGTQLADRAQAIIRSHLRNGSYLRPSQR